MQLLVSFSKMAASSRISGVSLAVIRPSNAVARFFFPSLATLSTLP